MNAKQIAGSTTNESRLMFTNLLAHDRTPAHRNDSTMRFGPRRGGFVNAAERMFEEGWPLDEATVEQCEAFDLVYRTLCAVMYNYVPLSGHPGGSISSGRFVARLLFDAMDYDLTQPNRQDADIISYAAGHKALGRHAAIQKISREATRWTSDTSHSIR
jgi:hypothetical protein